MAPHGILWYPMGHCATPWYMVVPLGTLWYPMVSSGALQYLVAHCGTLWYHGTMVAMYHST